MRLDLIVHFRLFLTKNIFITLNLFFRSEFDHGFVDDEVRVAATDRVSPHPVTDCANTHRGRYAEKKVACKL